MAAIEDPRKAGDRVMASLVNVCLPTVKGAHDSDFIIVNGKAYIVYMANDVQPGEDPQWPFVYSALSIVDVATGRVEQTETFAASQKVYENAALPAGACFVPRVIRRDESTLRVFFASEDPGARQSQTWYIDYDLWRGRFIWAIHQAQIQTDQGVFPMQPLHLYRHAAAKGFTRPQRDFGLYMIDSFKVFDGRVHVVLNNFSIRQIALATLNDNMDRFTVLGHFFEPLTAALSEAAVNRLPDGSWLAISRQEEGSVNYMFARSRDGATWAPHECWPLVPNGLNSKPTFECFDGVYHLGWQEATQINGASRSVFNIDTSRDGATWQRKYRFETEKSFQYPVFRQYRGAIYLTVTQGDFSDSRKERIMFGRLE